METTENANEMKDVDENVDRGEDILVIDGKNESVEVESVEETPKHQAGNEVDNDVEMLEVDQAPKPNVKLIDKLKDKVLEDKEEIGLNEMTSKQVEETENEQKLNCELKPNSDCEILIEDEVVEKDVLIVDGNNADSLDNKIKELDLNIDKSVVDVKESLTNSKTEDDIVKIEDKVEESNIVKVKELTEIKQQEDVKLIEGDVKVVQDTEIEQESQEDDIKIINNETVSDVKQCEEPAEHTQSNVKQNNQTEQVVDGEMNVTDVAKKLESVGNQVQCCNLHCNSGVVLYEAPLFVLSYYGSKRSDIVQKVCQSCYDVSCVHYDNLAAMAKNKIPLLTAMFPKFNDDVVVMDTVEEIKDTEHYLEPDDVRFVEENLISAIEEAIEKYDLNYQLKESERLLSEKMNELEATNNEIKKDVMEMERKLAKRRRMIYKEFEPKIKMMPPLNIPCENMSYRERTNRLRPVPLKPPAPPTTTPMMKQYMRIPQSSTPQPQQQQQQQQQLTVTTISPSQLSVSPTSSEVIAVKEVGRDISSLPPVGELSRQPLEQGDAVYMMKSSAYSIWLKARIMDVQPDGMYRVKFTAGYGTSTSKTVSGKQLAYNTPSSVLYSVGSRVIAVYQDIESPTKEALYVGVVAEPPKILNNFRYLIFFDDGYSQYVVHEKIHLVCEASAQVHEDVHPSSREFIRNYLQTYPERPMVRLQPGQVVRTEYNKHWLPAKVLEVDGSLAKIKFENVKRIEHIYRGSSRLEPLYSAFVAAAARKEQGGLSRFRNIGISSLKKMNMPYVQYTQDQEDKAPLQVSKNVAKKSTSKPTDNRPRPPEPHEKQEHATKGVIKQLKLDINMKGKKFVPHQCEKTCVEWTKFQEADCTGVSPLTIPLYFGFERLTQKSKTKRTIIYQAPCGRNLRSMEEIHRYLRIAKSTMGVDLFDVDHWVNILDEFDIDERHCLTSIPDISYGAENVKISCINELNHTWPKYMEYSATRIPQDGVNICLNEDFLVSCDCKDDCQDKEKCSCWQLTIEGTKAVNNGNPDYTVGYMYRRLPERVITGIYECNSRCKCASTCLNRVVQFPMQINLQIFNTKWKGWGIRTLNDIPQGGFVCTYAGRLHTEQSANEDGRKYGDEYLAELDYIEVVERYKEDYESEVVDPEVASKDRQDGEDNEDEFDIEDDEMLNESRTFGRADRDYVPNRVLLKNSESDNTYTTRAKNKRTANGQSDKEASSTDEGKDSETDKDNERNKCDEEEDETDAEREPSQFTAAVDQGQRSSDFKSIREMYGDGADECYIMDAKSSGNIGRYLNHSCQPNIFVQNVFVDTHDLRFPWVAFFALKHIKAGTELTWDYNYDVGSVPDKVLYCYCNSSECRGRLI